MNSDRKEIPAKSTGRSRCSKKAKEEKRGVLKKRQEGAELDGPRENRWLVRGAQGALKALG